MGMSKEGYKRAREAALRGTREAKERRVQAYKDNPKKCLQCENVIPYAKRENKFCNRSCSATFNNKG